MNYFDSVTGFTGGLSKATLAEGTNAATIKLTAALDFAINGVIYNKAITDNIAMTALPAQAANTTCLYGVQIDAALTVSIVKGVEVLTTRYAEGELCEIPRFGSSKCPVGIFKVATTSGFTSGTTDLAAAGTVTYYDLCGIPAGRL